MAYLAERFLGDACHYSFCDGLKKVICEVLFYRYFKLFTYGLGKFL
jgi:hypothetical protein